MVSDHLCTVLRCNTTTRLFPSYLMQTSCLFPRHLMQTNKPALPECPAMQPAATHWPAAPDRLPCPCIFMLDPTTAVASLLQCSPRCPAVLLEQLTACPLHMLLRPDSCPIRTPALSPLRLAAHHCICQVLNEACIGVERGHTAPLLHTTLQRKLPAHHNTPQQHHSVEPTCTNPKLRSRLQLHNSLVPTATAQQPS